MPETAERLVERLVSEGQKTSEFFQSFTTDQLEEQLYTEGSHWSVGQVMAHFVATELAIHKLMRAILNGDPGVAEDFDIDAYNEEHVAALRTQPLQKLLEQFTVYRQANIDLVQMMHQEDLQKTGRHPYLGVATLEDIIKLLYRHNQIHQRDVRKLLSGASE